MDRRLYDYVKIDKRFVVSNIYQLKMSSPDGTEISIQPHKGDYEIGYCLDRDEFYKELLNLALKEGPEYLNKTRATGLIREDGNIKGIKAKIDEKEDVEIRSNIVIGADGVESRVGKWAGIYEKSDTSIHNVWVELEAIVDNVNMDKEEYYAQSHRYGYKKMPNLYFYTEPRGDGRTSVGVMPLYAFIPKKGDLLNGLNYFLKDNPLFLKSKIVKYGGGAHFIDPLKNFTADNVMLVGDAAHHGVTLWYCGNLHAMDSGVLAGETAVEAHEEGDFSFDFFSRYEKKWYKLHGERLFIDSTLHRFGPWVHTYQNNKYMNLLLHLLKENNDMIPYKFFEELTKSAKGISDITAISRKAGLDIDDAFSIFTHFKKYYRSWWDTFVQ
jgi:digeranylgeranylglycerophospholipid reductase